MRKSPLKKLLRFFDRLKYVTYITRGTGNQTVFRLAIGWTPTIAPDKALTQGARPLLSPRCLAAGDSA